MSEIRVSKIRGSEIRVSEIRISSNHRELHGAIFCQERYIIPIKSFDRTKADEAEGVRILKIVDQR